MITATSVDSGSNSSSSSTRDAHVSVRYGRGEVEVVLPPSSPLQVLRMKPLPSLADPHGAVVEALSDPLGSPSLETLARKSVAHGRASACLVVCDATRPVPNALLLRPTLQVLQQAGIARENILILVATGLHRPSTQEEREEMLGAEIASEFRVEDHDARDEQAHQPVGGPDGIFVPALGRKVEVSIDARYLRAGVKIVLGLAEPHFMAGYSGGRKMVCPGIASASTIFGFHSVPMIAHPQARAGNLEGNPIHQLALGAAKAAGVDFSLMVTLSETREVTGLWGGDLEEVHARAVQSVDRAARVPVKPANIVVTSAAGHPLDATLYQTIKALSGAAPAVRPGGTIIVLSEMAQGVGSPEFRDQCRLFRPGAAWEEALARAPVQIDQWQLQKASHALRHASASIVSSSHQVQSDLLVSMGIEPFQTAQAALQNALQANEAGGGSLPATICVIPEGPYVLPDPLASADAASST